MDGTGLLALAAGLGVGVGAGVLLTYIVTVRGLLASLREMRFAGWRTVEKVEQPKTVPLPFVRED